MLIRLNVDQVRVVGLCGALGLADMGLGRHGAGPKWGLAEMGRADAGNSV